MKFVCYSSWQQVPDSANVLFAQAEKDSIYYSRAWFESLADLVPDNQQSMLLACVESGSRVMAILPLLRNAGNTWYALGHRYTTHFSLLLADDEQHPVLTCLVQGLKQLAFTGLILEPVADNDPGLNALKQAMEAAGFKCEYLFRSYNWVYRMHGQSYDEYINARPTRLRNTIARKQRKLEREYGYKIRLFTAEEVPAGMHDYYAVYTASWKANEQFAGFMDSFVARFSKQGWSRLAVLYVDDQPIAAQLWFVLHGKASIFRLAYDKAWKSYSPGSILTSYLMKYVIDTDKVDEIDFLTGNDAYKQDWMSERRERFALSCIRTGKPAGNCKRFVGLLRRVLKRHD